MSEADFLRLFAEAVGADEGSVRLDTLLSTLEGWDSVAYLSTMTFLDEQTGVAVGPDQLLEAQTPGDILLMAQPKN